MSWDLLGPKSGKKWMQSQVRIGQNPPTDPAIRFLIFFETCTVKTKQKKTNDKKTKQMRVATLPTHPLPSFSLIFWFFFTWQNLLLFGVIMFPSAISACSTDWSNIKLARINRLKLPCDYINIDTLVDYTCHSTDTISDSHSVTKRE